MRKKETKICCVAVKDRTFSQNVLLPLFTFRDVTYVYEFEIKNNEDFLKKCLKSKIDLFLFLNPYGNKNRLSFYQYLRQHNTIPYLATDRGALPNSWFFDPNGFNADSSSYDALHWDHPLTEERKQRVEEYIKTQIQTDISLEKQGDMIGSDNLRKKLGIAADKKILFVPLQRPSDTVIKYFSGHVKDVDDFLNQIVHAQKMLADDWVFLAKKHPLEVVKPFSERLHYVDDNTHFKDLLQLCDAVALINSGVGVTAMMYQKPVYYFGDAFYGHQDINLSVASAAQLVDALQGDGCVVNREKMQRFVSYLIEDFYSFGTFHTRESTEGDGSKRTITTGIDFSQVRNITQHSAFDVLMVTDVKFWLNAVGNQARIYRLLLALQKKFNIAVFFIGQVSDEERLQLKQSDINALVEFADDISGIKQENEADLSSDNPTLKRFYNISIIRKFAYFSKNISYNAVIIEYIKYDYLFTLLNPQSHRIIDIHDLFFQRTESYRQNNDVNFIEVSEEEELRILQKYDTIVSIQKNDQEYLNRHLPHNNNLLIPHHVPISNSFSVSLNALNVGFIASSANIPHFEWFMKNVWPYFECIEGISLNLYGNICNSSAAKKYNNTRNLILRGLIANISQAYEQIDISINPVRYGSGLKIKNVEALAHGIPLITTDIGMQGMEDGANSAFLLANTVDEWIDAILMYKISPTLRKEFSKKGLEYCGKHFSEDVYTPLINIIKGSVQPNEIY